jgi:hypothetical protein
MRFGSAAPRLLRLAGGTDDRRVLPAPSTPRLHACLSFEDSVSDRERLLQAIDRPLTDLYRQMDLLGLAAHALHLRLRLEDGSTYDAILPLFEPLASLHQLRRLVHWHMEPLELAGVVAEIEVELTSLYRLQGRQLELFAPRDGRDARDLLGEVTARWGPDTLRQGVLKTSRRLETGFVWITPKPPENKSMAYDRKTLPSQVTLRPHPVIRLLAEPREVLVHLEEGQPGAITVRQTPERIVAIGGPWRLVEGWWDTPLDRDEYQVSTASGVYYVVHDRQAGTWLLLGAFD